MQWLNERKNPVKQLNIKSEHFASLAGNPLRLSL